MELLAITLHGRGSQFDSCLDHMDCLIVSVNLFPTLIYKEVRTKNHCKAKKKKVLPSATNSSQKLNLGKHVNFVQMGVFEKYDAMQPNFVLLSVSKEYVKKKKKPTNQMI